MVFKHETDNRGFALRRRIDMRKVKLVRPVHRRVLQDPTPLKEFPWSARQKRIPHSLAKMAEVLRRK